MMRELFEKQLAGIEARLAQPGQEALARKKYVREVARLGSRLYAGEHSVAWCGVMAPFDLLHAMGVTSCFIEFIGAMLASTGGAAACLEEAESRGFPTDLCAYHRAVIGAANQGLMPEPSFLVATTAPCSGGLSTLEYLAHHFDKDLFVLQIPWGNDAAAVGFLAEQLRELAAFVSAHTGQPLDPDRLRRTLQRSNRTCELLIDIYRLAATVPTPARRNDMPNLGFILALLAGSEEGEALATAYRDELGERVAEGKAGVPGERARLLWFQNRIQFRNPVAQLLEEEFQAAVVVDELNQVNFDPVDLDHPFEGISARTLSIPLCSTADRRIDSLLRLVREYRVDGVIHPCHWGCRQGTGARGMVEAALAREGIPVLNLEVDCVDQRNFSEGQIRTRLQAFLEMIEGRKSAARTTLELEKGP